MTAANASQLSDGAAAVLLADMDAALADGLRPLARFKARVAIGLDPVLQLTGVIPAAERALARRPDAARPGLDRDQRGLRLRGAGLAARHRRQSRACQSLGGAIAHGHPLGATGAGLMAKMLAGLRAIDGQFGMQLMCIGHGMATATILERL